MFSRFKFVVVLAFLFFSVSVATPLQASAEESNPQRAALLAQINSLLELIATLQAQLVAAQQREAVPVETETQKDAETTDDEEWSFDINTQTHDYIHSAEENYEDDLELDANVYQVRNNRIYIADNLRERIGNVDTLAWEIFNGVSDPELVEEHLGWFVTFVDPDTDTLAYVWRVHNDERGWALVVNVAGVDTEDNESVQGLASTLLHEYGHLISLNSTQVQGERISKDRCERFERDGFYLKMSDQLIFCVRERAYLNDFIKMFWTEDEADRAIEYYKNHETEAIYTEKKDAFITWYAASTPAEDFAESYSGYILGTQTGKEIATEKINFFRQYPEFVTDRNKIRENLKQYFQ